ncbi:MAG: CRISPR-associated endoribonuclease Cas6 [Planctomycetota bacterium]|nr:MAG: CRISPR-associated endoribonuclease Cas6 [Planctomycetota bacterium]
MRFSLELNSDQKILNFSKNYPHQIQALIYQNLPDEEAHHLHTEGFRYEKRTFKLFTFSRIQGKMPRKKNRNAFLFFSPIRIQIASAKDKILQLLAANLIKKEYVQLGPHKLRLHSISVHKPLQFQPVMKIRMLSPMTMYSTLEKGDQKKITHYYTPFDQEFSELISSNLQKKYYLLHNENTTQQVHLTPLFQGNRERILIFKNTVIKAWDGQYLLQGPIDLLKIAYDTGLGCKNSQGFGMWEAI